MDITHSSIPHAPAPVHSVHSLSRVSGGDINVVPQVPHLTRSQSLQPQASSSSLDVGPGGDVQRDIPTVSVARSDVVPHIKIDASNGVNISNSLQDAVAGRADIPPPPSKKGLENGNQEVEVIRAEQSMGASSRSGEFNERVAVSIDSGMPTHKFTTAAPKTLANPVVIPSSQPKGRRVSFSLSQDSTASSPVPFTHPTVVGLEAASSAHGSHSRVATVEGQGSYDAGFSVGDGVTSSGWKSGEGVRVMEAQNSSAGGRQIVAYPPSPHSAYASTVVSRGDGAKGETLVSSERDTASDSVRVGNRGANRHHLQSRGGDGLGSTGMSGINGTIRQDVRHGVVEGDASVDHILTGTRMESAGTVPRSSAESSGLGGEGKYSKGVNALTANHGVAGIKVDQNMRGTRGLFTNDERALRVSSSSPVPPGSHGIVVRQSADNASKHQLASQVLHESSKSDELTKSVRIQDHTIAWFVL